MDSTLTAPHAAAKHASLSTARPNATNGTCIPGHDGGDGREGDLVHRLAPVVRVLAKVECGGLRSVLCG